MERLKAFFKLMRLRHTAQIVGTVALFSVVSHGFSVQSLCAILASLFLSISVFFLDDASDIDSDQIEHPQRPVPKGLFTIRQAYTIGAIFLFVSIFLASALFLYQFAIFIAATAIAIAIIFFKLKSVLRASLIAFLMWALIPFGAFPDVKTTLFGLVIALPHLGGSITKDYLHSRGDIAHGLEPPPDWAKYLASAAFFLSGAIIWLPKILDFVTWFYVPPIIITQATCLVLGARVLKGRYEKVYILGGIGMCSALIAFLLGGT